MMCISVVLSFTAERGKYEQRHAQRLAARETDPLAFPGVFLLRKNIFCFSPLLSLHLPLLLIDFLLS